MPDAKDDAKSPKAQAPDPTPPAPDPEPAPPPPARPRTVTVYCSIPSGLWLALDKHFVLPVSNTADGGHADGYKVAVPMRRIKVNAGPNPGIDADFWNAWLIENAGYSAVLSGHIFATEDSV